MDAVSIAVEDSDLDLAAQVKHGVAGDLHAVACQFAPEFAATGGNLPGVSVQ